MAFNPTRKSAVSAGAAVGLMTGVFQPLVDSDAFAALILVVLFLASAFIFTIGLSNLHIKTVWSWSDLTEGERQAISRIPLWFGSMALTFFASALFLGRF